MSEVELFITIAPILLSIAAFLCFMSYVFEWQWWWEIWRIKAWPSGVGEAFEKHGFARVKFSFFIEGIGDFMAALWIFSRQPRIGWFEAFLVMIMPYLLATLYLHSDSE